jgi:hypothetical protein
MKMRKSGICDLQTQEKALFLQVKNNVYPRFVGEDHKNYVRRE